MSGGMDTMIRAAALAAVLAGLPTGLAAAPAPDAPAPPSAASAPHAPLPALDLSVRPARAALQGEPIYASPAEVQQVQRALSAHGYQTGEPDGTWNPQTREAARSFEQSLGLAPSGELSLRLLVSLGLAPMLQGRAPAAAPADAASEANTDSDPGVPINAGTPLVREVQHRLIEAGFSAGAPDGTWGPQTARAAAEFQRRHELAPTGTLDLALLHALGVAPVGEPQAPPPPGEPSGPHPGAPLYLSPDMIRMIQRDVQQAGCIGCSVSADGVWSRATEAAVRNYQRSSRLEPTGTPTLATLSRLGIALGSTQLALAGDTPPPDTPPTAPAQR